MNIGNFFKRFWIVLVIVILAAGGIIAWQLNKQAAKSSVYQTAALTRGNLTASVGATGTVHAGQSTTLTWQTSGRVEKVNVKIGDTVKVDDVLSSLLQTSMSQNIILAEADLITAKKNLDDLVASRTSLAQAELNLANAKQDVEDAQDKVDSITFDRASDNLILQTQASIDLAKREIGRAHV